MGTEVLDGPKRKLVTNDTKYDALDARSTKTKLWMDVARKKYVNMGPHH